MPEPLEGSGTTRYFRSNGKPSYNGTVENYAFPNNASNISAVLGNSPNGVYLDIEGVTVNDDLTLANKPGIATLAGWYGRKAIRNSLSLTGTNAGLNFKDMGFLNDSNINDVSNTTFYRCDFNANLNIGAGKIGETRLVDCSIGDPSDTTKTLTINAPVNTVSGLDTSLVVIKGSGNGVLYLNMLGDATAANSKQLQVYVEGFTQLILLNHQAGHLSASNIPLLYFVSSTAPKHINNQIALTGDVDNVKLGCNYMIETIPTGDITLGMPLSDSLTKVDMGKSFRVCVVSKYPNMATYNLIINDPVMSGMIILGVQNGIKMDLGQMGASLILTYLGTESSGTLHLFQCEVGVGTNIVIS